MAEPVDGIMPILRKIQEDISSVRKDTRALQAKVNDMAENILELKADMAEMKQVTLMHLALTTKHRVGCEELQ
jgi:hypothetical protein